jgi:hypothetical protein
MGAVVRVVSMVILGLSSMVKLLVALLFVIGAGFAGIIASNADEVADKNEGAVKESAEKGGKEARKARDSFVQEAGGVAFMAIGAMIIIAYVSNRERYLAPGLAVGLIASEIWFGVRFGFSWLPYSGILGSVLAIAGWLALRMHPPPEPGR